MITHLLRCHLMMEPTAVASWRNLPSVHPVWKLLYPHTKGIMAINTLGRNDLIPDGGVADKVLSIGGGGQVTLMQKYYRSVTFDSYYIVDALKDRGVSELRKFYYKDDATLLWNAIEGFVGDIINIYYKNDKDVQQVSTCHPFLSFALGHKVINHQNHRMFKSNLVFQLHIATTRYAAHLHM